MKKEKVLIIITMPQLLPLNIIIEIIRKLSSGISILLHFLMHFRKNHSFSHKMICDTD